MEYIITQITVKMVEEILKIIGNDGISEIGQTTEAILSVLKEKTLEILSATIEEVDLAILSAKKERKIDGITVKQRNVPRTVSTLIGDLTTSGHISS